MLLDILKLHFTDSQPIFFTLMGRVVFCLLFLGAAWMTGRSLAKDWKPLWNLAIAILVLGVGARFIHFALYAGPFLSISHYLLDTLCIGVAAVAGYQATRTNQMAVQYHWLYDKASPFTWRSKT
jgi:small-conductance mechanosensitive channel